MKRLFLLICVAVALSSKAIASRNYVVGVPLAGLPAPIPMGIVVEGLSAETDEVIIAKALEVCCVASNVLRFLSLGVLALALCSAASITPDTPKELLQDLYSEIPKPIILGGFAHVVTVWLNRKLAQIKNR